MKRKSQAIILLICSFIILSSLNAQVPYVVRSGSMGATSVAGSTDIDAIGLNPANIINNRPGTNGKIYFSFATNFGFQTKSSYLSIDFYDSYLKAENQVLTDQDKQTILNNASNETSYGVASLRLLSAVYNAGEIGSFGFSIEETFRGDFAIARDLFDIALYGNTANTFYTAQGTNANAFWVREINISYANLIQSKKSFFDRLSYGVALKPQFGIYYLETLNNNLAITTNSQNQIIGTGDITLLYSGLTDDINFKFSTDNSGFGIAADAGANMSLKNLSKNIDLDLGFSVTDIGYISWTKNTANYFYDGNLVITDITDPAQRDSLKNYLKETKTPVASFTTSLPTQVRLGGTLRFLGKPEKGKETTDMGSISLDYVQGLSDNLGGTTKPMVGLGFEYNIGSVVSPRFGFVFGGEAEFLASFGVGIDAGPVVINLGTGNIANIFTPTTTTKVSLGMDIKFRVN